MHLRKKIVKLGKLNQASLLDELKNPKIAG
jgi:hypothetical protein